MSILSALVFTIVALVIALALYGRPGLQWEAILVAIFSLWILPAALSAIYEGVLISGGKLRVQTRLMIAAETVGLAVTAFGFWAGWNILSLVAGRLAMQMAHLMGAVIATRWFPRVSFNRAFARELLDFSRHILLTRLMFRVRCYAGTLALGSFMGLTEAGLFRAAERIVAAISELVSEPARLLAWVVFRRASGKVDAGDETALPRAATTYVAVMLTLATPLYVGLALVSEPLVRLALGDRWAPAALVVSLLCLRQLFLVPSYVTEPLLSIAGEVRRLPPVSILNTAVTVGAMVTLAPFGLVAASVGQIGAAVFALVTTVVVQSRYGGVTWGQVLRNTASVIVASGALAASTAGLGAAISSMTLQPATVIAVQAMGGAAAYLLVLLAAVHLGVSNPLFSPGKTHGDPV